jgi:hypothetical protein
MWRRGNDFEAIPRLFDGENETICRIAAARINCNFSGRLRKDVA